MNPDKRRAPAESGAGRRVKERRRKPGDGRSKRPDEMEGFRPGPGNTGSMDGRDDTGQRQVNHEI